MVFNYEEFARIPKKNSDLVGKPQGSMTEMQGMDIVRKVASHLGLNGPTGNEEAMAIISGICQIGGTNRNAGPNVQFRYGDKVLNATDFQRICREVVGPKATARQFARAMKSHIQKFAQILEVEGDLARQMRLDFPSLSLEDAIWCANYQSENPDCPDMVRNWLKEDLKRRFRI